MQMGEVLAALIGTSIRCGTQPSQNPLSLVNWWGADCQVFDGEIADSQAPR